MEIINNENREICSKCGGRCCKSSGCELSPEDIKGGVTKENIMLLLNTGNYSIDWWEGNPFDENDYSISHSFFLRTRCRDSEIVDPILYPKPCILLEEGKGCKLAFEERPKAGRALEPREGRCISHYGKQQASQDWYKYNDILREIVKEIEGTCNTGAITFNRIINGLAKQEKLQK